MSKKNPFEVLGINPETLKGISDSQADVLVKDCYRALAKIFHPDNGGNAEDFRVIQEAYGELLRTKNPKQYEYHKLWHLKQKKGGVTSNLTARINELLLENEALQKAYSSFSYSLLAEPGSEKEPIWQKKNFSLILRDHFHNVRLHDLEKNQPAQGRGIQGKTGENISIPVMELMVDKKGAISIQEVSIRESKPREARQGYYSYAIANNTRSPKFAIEPCGELRQLTNIRLLGCSILHRYIGSERKTYDYTGWKMKEDPLFSGRALATTMNSQGIDTWLSMEQISPYLSTLQPSLMIGQENIRSNLIAVREGEKNIQFQILGSVFAKKIEAS